jgi:hypothetical protein
MNKTGHGDHAYAFAPLFFHYYSKTYKLECAVIPQSRKLALHIAY